MWNMKLITIAASSLLSLPASKGQSSKNNNAIPQIPFDVPTHHLGGTSLRVTRALLHDEDDEECDPNKVVLADYPQWQDEEGYWIGRYSFYDSMGAPFVSSTWNYPYNDYYGYITGNVEGNAYRQRNVFLYPPQSPEVCATTDNLVQGNGTCGVNGNTKIFAADQSATTCSTNPELGGDIEGPYAGVFNTTTELVGKDNALLYQVFLGEALFQSQLTSITTDAATGQVQRTRTAQGFQGGLPSSVSFYRERKVDKETFYQSMAETVALYNITDADLCGWIDNPTFNPPLIGTGLPLGMEGCRQHLEESFALTSAPPTNSSVPESAAGGGIFSYPFVALLGSIVMLGL